ncbi:MAG: glycosyltransferase [Flavobacteriales bacterium]|nr:glycosyltransferase [Flavobacteriales bacterium]
MKILYLSYDGMLDPLGQSQVIPYIQGLVRKGHAITLISFEKKQLRHGEVAMREYLAASGIDWVPLNYRNKLPVLSTLGNVRRLVRKTRDICEYKGIQAVHCRSYIPLIAGLKMKQERKLFLVFDMRGFYADERAEGGLWKRSNPIYNAIYKYFKKVEKQGIAQADHIVSLTTAARVIMERDWMEARKVPVSVIPCCADPNVFTTSVEEPRIKAWKNKLDIPDDHFVLGYLGSIGTWYMLDEMLAFFKVLLEKRSNAVFLFISPDPPSLILSEGVKHGIPADRIRVQRLTRNEVAEAIHVFDLSIFFIRPVFSKKASSPTKMGELLNAGIPIITNAGVGDVDQVYEEAFNLKPVMTFTESAYHEALENLDHLLDQDPEHLRETALRHFSLEQGIEAFDRIYCSLQPANDLAS